MSGGAIAMRSETHQENQPHDETDTPHLRCKPVVVGVYGIPGSGKTHLLKQLKDLLGEGRYSYIEGSYVIDTLVPGGLDAFHRLDESGKNNWRRLAIEKIKQECHDSNKVGIVAAHFMFWDEGQEAGEVVWTEDDADTFTHVIYLDVPGHVLAQRRSGDIRRSRPSMSVKHLGEWQSEEEKQLRQLCHERGILFLLVNQEFPFAKFKPLFNDYRLHSERGNEVRAVTKIDSLIPPTGQLTTVVLMDADRTLSPEDTGALFWNEIGDGMTLTRLFESPARYSYTAFRQATLLYEENVVDDAAFDLACEAIARRVSMYSEVASLLQSTADAKRTNVKAVIVTCGLKLVWEKVLKKVGLSENVTVIGGNRIADRFVITPEVKGALVTRLREHHRLYVWAFGDSPLDLEMLKRADQAVVVVGDERKRSKTMDAALLNAIQNEDLHARQALLSATATPPTPRLDTDKLPLINLRGEEFTDCVLSHRVSLQIIHATERNTAKLLATSMRDSAVAGPELREAHRRAGLYLAVEYLTDVIGVEKAPIQHVQGRETMGFRLLNEQKTTIVALMRGGEPMAYGVNDAFPRAMFLHAKDADDIKSSYLDGQQTVVLVDSVINTGKTIVDTVKQVRKLHKKIRIVVVAGVLQAKCLDKDSPLQELASCWRLHIVALRLSSTSFVGTGTNDTGNRLFNTTHLP